jgi:hypothetical protein
MPKGWRGVTFPAILEEQLQYNVNRKKGFQANQNSHRGKNLGTLELQ